MVKVKKYVTEKQYLSASNDADEIKDKKFVIDAVFPEVVNDVEKLCLRLKGITKKLILNQTNITILSASFGDDTDMWVSKPVTIRIVKVKFNGELVPSIQTDA
jgi:hypothetical protein